MTMHKIKHWTLIDYASDKFSIVTKNKYNPSEMCIKWHNN